MGYLGIASQKHTVVMESGKTIVEDITIVSDPAAIPQTTIVSGPSIRTNPGDPSNYYCTKIKATINKCCRNTKILISYDNPNISSTDFGSCTPTRETYLCSQLSSGNHTFYYKTNNTDCGEEELRSVSFQVQ